MINAVDNLQAAPQTSGPSMMSTSSAPSASSPVPPVTSPSLSNATLSGIGSSPSTGMNTGAGSPPAFDDVVSQIKKDSVGAVPPPRSNMPPLKKKSHMGSIIAGLALLLLIVGGGIGYLVVTNRNQSTELRQQASTGDATAACGSACTTSADCVNGTQCSANKCVLTACATNPSQCATSLCSLAETTSSAACSVAFNVPTSTITCQKTAYRDELNNSAGNYTLTQQQATFQPGDVVVFQITLQNTSNQTLNVSAQDILTANNLNNVTFLDSNCGNTAYTSSSRTLNCPAVSIASGANATRTFRVKINNGVSSGTVITNNATANTGSAQATCSTAVTVNVQTTPTPTPTPTYSCNTNCSTNAQCQTANGSYICSSSYGNTCRLDSNPSSSTCTPTTTTYSCNSSCSTNAQCQTVNSNYVCSNSYCRLGSNPTSATCSPPTTTVIGCNETCATNADCSSADQICSDTSSGKRCRLATNTSSSTCSPPTTITYTTPTPTPTTTTTTPSQPPQTEKLPVSGAGEDIMKFLGIGAGVLILGAAGLLLL